MPSFLSPASSVQPGYLVSAEDVEGESFRGTVTSVRRVSDRPDLIAWGRVGSDDETLVIAGDLVTIHPAL